MTWSLPQTLVCASLLISFLLLLRQRRVARSVKQWGQVIDDFRKTGIAQKDPKLLRQVIEIQNQLRVQSVSYSLAEYLSLVSVVLLQVCAVLVS